MGLNRDTYDEYGTGGNDMSEIKLDKEAYDRKMSYLSYMGEYIHPAVKPEVYPGSNVSDTMESFYEMYLDIITLARLYKWTLQHSVQALKDAGEAMYQTDRDLANNI